MIKLKKTFIPLVFLALCFQTGSVFAALNLSVISVDGSNSLRLGRVSSGSDNKQQLRVRITATDGAQYQVFQRVIEPIVNERGENLNLQSIETATLPNTNASGTLYLQNAERLGMGEQLVYTSGQGGPSDEFQIAYAVRPELLNVSGNLMGKIVFTLRPIGSGTPQQVLVNMSLENVADAAWKMAVTGGHTPGMVRVKDADTTPANADFVKLSFSGNAGEDVRIYQEIESPLQDMMAQEIGADVLKFGVDGVSSESIRSSGISSLGRIRVLLYDGRKAEDEVSVYFLVDPELAAQQSAGRYAGKLRYTVERDNSSESFSIDLECQVQSFFVMDLGLPPEGVKFSHVLSTDPPIDKEVMVTVRSNTRKAYQVAQSLSSLMVNDKGEEIKKEYLTFKVEIPKGQKGHTKYTDFSPMETGEYPVFSSDGEGSPVTFKVVYRLKGYAQMSGGEFSAPIRYSLNQN
jgi:hypothetical protein